MSFLERNKIRVTIKMSSIHLRYSIKKGVLRNLAKFARTQLCQILWHRCFPVNFAKFLRTTFLQNSFV